jgi:two-component system, LytTR family, response regulator
VVTNTWIAGDGAVPLKTLIVDDEPIARRVLREELESMADVDVIGEADSGASALVQIERLKPDLVLLDLQMPGMGGLEVIRNLRRAPHVPIFVIVTAHDAYAVQAFEADAVDYLLKPVRRQRLEAAVERARRVRGRQAAEKLAHLQGLLAHPADSRPKKIVGKQDQEYFLLSTDEILAFQAEGDIVWIITLRERYVAALTLKAIEELLVTSGFRRIHRNALVNVNHVRKMSVLSSQRWLITLSNNQELIASKRLVGSIRRLLMNS